MSGLPSGWVETSLGEVTTWGSGGTPSRSNPDYFGGSIPWVTISDLNDGLVSHAAASITEAGLANSAAKLVSPGAILIALYGSIGKLGVAGVPLSTNQAIAHTLPSEQVLDTRYLFHYLHSERNGLLATGSGVTQKNIYLGDLKAYPFRLAPRTEQTRIVEKLEELLSGLDAAVAELKAGQKKLAQYRQSLLKAAVEGALTAQWREQQRAKGSTTETGAQLLQRILAERRARWEAKQLAKFKAQGKPPPAGWQAKYPEPTPPDTTHLPALPEGWVWASIDQLATVGTGVTPLRSNSSYFTDGDIPWVTSGALNDEFVTEATEYVTALALEKCRLTVYPAGALLLAMYGEGKTRGKCSELTFPATINQAIAALVLEGAADSCRNYLKSFLWKSYEDMRLQASGGVQPNLNLQIVKSIAVPLPSLAEQAQLQLVLDAQSDVVVQQALALNSSLKQAAAQRQNILRAAFSGQVVAQNPADEPATVLLERIRAQRAGRSSASKGKKRKALS